MESINVENLLREVRRTIEERQLDGTVPSFDERSTAGAPSQTSGKQNRKHMIPLKGEGVDTDRMEEICSDLDAGRSVSPDVLLVQSEGVRGKMISQVKKVVRRCLIPVVDQQNEFNDAVARAIQLLLSDAADSSKEKARIADLERQIAVLTERIEQLEKRDEP